MSKVFNLPPDSSSTLAAPNLAAIKDRYELLASMFEGTEDRVFAKDLHGRYLMVNTAVSEFFGRTQAEIIGKTDWDLLPSAEARVFAESDQRVVSSGEPASYEFQTSRGPRHIHLHTAKSPLRDSHGKIVGVIGIGRDITARKQIEEALRLSEARFTAAQEIAQFGSWEWNLITNRVVWSAECYRIFGLDPTSFEATYANVARYFHPSNVERFREVLAAAVKYGTEFKDDFRIVRPDGEERYLHVEGVVTHYAADGGPLVMTGTSFDITARKQTELALRRSESNFAHAQRIAQVGSWEWVPSTGRVLWTREAQRIFGFIDQSRDIISRGDFLNYIHPDDCARVSAAIDAALSHGVPYDLTFRTLAESGERIIHSLGEMHRDHENVPVLTGVCRDITEQRRLHELLRSSEANLAQAQRIARIASWRWEMRTGHESWSAEIHDMLELDRSLPMNYRRFLTFVHADDRVTVTAAFNPTLMGAAPYSLDFRVLTQRGRERFIHSLGETIRDVDGNATSIIGILQDITERKRIEEELFSSRDELRGLMNHLQHLQEDERRHIAREIHDEFGAVFTAANISLYRLANQLQTASPQTRELLASTKEMIANAGKSLDDIVNGLHPQMLTHLGLAATLEWYISEFEKRTGIRCVRSVPDEGEMIDEQRSIALFRCLQESLTNIAKHAAASLVCVTFTTAGPQLVLSIVDDGRGIAADALIAPDAFGLRGLEARVTQLGGSFKVHHQIPQGTRVLVTIPKQTSAKRGAHD